MGDMLVVWVAYPNCATKYVAWPTEVKFCVNLCWRMLLAPLLS
jgi:hypothetical protein